ncbi:hypothetical protein ACFCWH_35290, partial [Streptomyces virginiae]
RATWTAPPDAVHCEVTLTGPRGPVPVPPVARAGSRETLRVEGPTPGRYAWVVRARYAPKGGAERGALSAPVTVPVTVHAWPEPVLTLTALPREAGGVEFRRTGGDGAEVRLVRWPGTTPAERAELTAAELPPPLDWAGPGWTDAATNDPATNVAGTSVPGAGLPGTGGPACVGHPPPGSQTVVSAVSVLGARAVAGPSVLVEAPLPVTGLVLRRAAPDVVEVGFDWPGAAGTVTAAVTQDGRRTELAVARSVFLREGLRLPVTPAALSVEVHAAPRSARSVLASPGADARAELPADVAVSYELVPGARRGLRRGPAVLRVTVRAPGGAPGPDLPDLPGFVLVARGDGGRDPRRPSGPADGPTVCRVTGAELAAAAAGTGTGTGTVERPIDTAVAPGRPYALRGFLLGGSAASVRLEEPPLPTLVIR